MAYHSSELLSPAQLPVHEQTIAMIDMNHLYTQIIGGNYIPETLFEDAYQRTLQRATNLWHQAHMVAVFNEETRVNCRIEYSPPNSNQFTLKFVNLHAIPHALLIQEFQNVMESKFSFQLQAFRDAPMIRVNILIHFQREFLLLQPPAGANLDQIEFVGYEPEYFQVGPVVHPPPGGVQTRGQQRALEIQELLRGIQTRGRTRRIEELRNRARRVYYGKYEDIKKRLFHPETLEDYFEKTDALLRVPDTEAGICFPMAFLKSQIRTIGEDQIYEDKIRIFEFWKEEFPPEANLIPTDFCQLTEEKVRIVLFSRTKPQQTLVDGRKIFPDVSADVARTWMWCAVRIHLLIQMTLHREVNYHEEVEMCQVYANFFHVHIHLYELIGSGRKYKTYLPDVRVNALECMEHVHVAIEGMQHCCSITHIRHFFRNFSGSGKMSLHNFCDYCGYVTNDSVNYTKARKHIDTCREKNPGCQPLTLCQFEQQTVPVDMIQQKFKDLHRIHCALCGTTTKRKKGCIEASHFVEYEKYIQCSTCLEEVTEEETMFHQCFMNLPKIPEAVPNQYLWVFDVEALQIYVGNQLHEAPHAEMSALVHEMNLACVRKMYDANVRLEYATRDAFVKDLVENEIYDHGVFLAHNGGGYDHQYILQYIELHNIAYDVTPSAGSEHRILCLEFKGRSGHPRRFIDFMAFVSGSLKYIGESFGLSIAKGDFPHLFSNVVNQTYEGPMPEKKYYGYEQLKTAKDQEKFSTWYEEERLKFCHCEGICGCILPKWNFQMELRKYCWLDVDVLAEAARIYREDVMQSDVRPGRDWNYVGLDPYSLITQAQIAILIFMRGDPTQPIWNSQFAPPDSPKAVLWLESFEADIVHQGNVLTRPYIKKIGQYVSGFEKTTNTVYQFYDCHKEKCRICFPDLWTEKESIEKESIRHRNFMKLRESYNVMCMWEHDFDRQFGILSEVELKKGETIQDREFFYGGRTEVFSAFGRSSEQREIKYFDVCSLYPDVCANCYLPIGIPTVYYRPREWQRNWFGYARIAVRCHPQDRLGLLPSRDPVSHRLEFNLLDKIGVWSTEEINLALDNGYQVLEIFQVFHWDEGSRSKELFRGYVAHFFQGKQESEGWIKNGASCENPSEEEKDRIVQKLYEENDYLVKIRKDKVRKNPCVRHIRKIFLNTLWGKYCQQMQQDFYTYVVSYDQYRQVMNHPLVDKNTIEFRHIAGNYFKCRYRKIQGFHLNSNRYNIFLAAMVTAHARCKLHRMMLKIGPENILYCDTDSILALVQTGLWSDWIGSGLGNWVDEYPSKKILQFYGIAPKSYYLVFENYVSMKTKGIRLTMENQEKITVERMQQMIREVFQRGVQKEEDLKLQHFTITSNSIYAKFPYATLFSFYTDKVLRLVLQKRQVVQVDEVDFEVQDQLFLLPKGYHE